MNFPPEITKNTIVDKERLQCLYDLLTDTYDVPGEIAEVGVYKGGTAYLLRLYSNLRKTVYLFDTFTGMPYSKEGVDHHKVGDFGDASIYHVMNLFKERDDVVICPGVFPRNTAIAAHKETFSFVHLDCDVYDSVFKSLLFFWQRLNRDGIIVFDDYNAPTCPGAKKAVDEFFKPRGIDVFPTVGSQAYVRKP